MARARLISQKICWSERVNALPLMAEILYYRMILHTDKYGRLKAEPILIKNTILPLRKVTLKMVRYYLELMENSKKNGLGLIQRYEVEGRKYLYMPGFDSEQAPEGGTAWRGRETVDSGIPAPPDWIPPSEETPVVDKKLGKVFTCYEDNIGLLTPMIADELKAAEKLYPVNWIIDAIQEAVKQNKRKWSYISAILERWKAEGRGPKKPAKVQGEENPLSKLVTE